MKLRSIKFRLSSVLYFSLFLLIVLGLFSLERLVNFNKVTAEIRDLWLENTRILGDMNNFTSDFRANEGNHILSQSRYEIQDAEKEIEHLNQSIWKAQSNYEQIFHDKEATGIYAQFVEKWKDYKHISSDVIALSRSGHKKEAILLYKNESRFTYNEAIEKLARLTELNVSNAREATHRADTTYKIALFLIIAAMMFSGLMVTSVIIGTKSSIFDPLLTLAACMRRLADNDTGIEIGGVERQDEIGEMARAVVVFRNNAVELAISQRDLGLQAALLEKMLEDERRLTALQRNFVSMASHEFRTPLTIIDGHAQRLIKMKNRLQPDDIAMRSNKIRGAVLMLTNLIKNLFNSSRLYDGNAELYFTPAKTDLKELLLKACQSQKEIAPELKLIAELGDEPLEITGDQELLSHVFSNLLSNAVKYSPNGEAIVVSVAMEPDRVAISVQDHGIGIPKKDMEHLFERYYRGSNVFGIVGTGIGLHLVKVFVELHGGRIDVVSKEDEGSTFTVWLPRVLT